VFFGRIHSDKGTAEAVEVAERAGSRLIVAGIVQDQEYFDRFVVARRGEDSVEEIVEPGGGEADGAVGGVVVEADG
jgi:hypothetical protein